MKEENGSLKYVELQEADCTVPVRLLQSRPDSSAPDREDIETIGGENMSVSDP